MGTEKREYSESKSIRNTGLRFLQGMLIGTGAILPGISGGVLCVAFGIYRPVMQTISNPVKGLREYGKLLFWVIIGAAAGFLGIAGILSYFLKKYPEPSTCLFIGLIAGMFPALLKEAKEKGHHTGDGWSLAAGFILIVSILLALQYFSVAIIPGFFSMFFCGICAALSVIIPGMSFSTFLMPLHLYTPFVEGIAAMDFSILVPAGIGALLTLVLCSRMVNWLFDHYYSQAFHGIIGITAGATLLIVPFNVFTSGWLAFLINASCLVAGCLFSRWMDQWSLAFEKPAGLCEENA